jgi:hypothetical protein
MTSAAEKAPIGLRDSLVAQCITQASAASACESDSLCANIAA